MISEKPFLTYAQQLDKLENEKNLIVNDKVHAEAILKRLSYFALISGYKKLFRNPTTQKYKDNTTFEDIVALYKFDESLRILFLKHLLQIEQAIRSMMSYYFTQKYGESQSEYLNKMNFNQTPRKQVTLTKLINILQNIAVNSTDYPYVSYQRESYGNVPLWVLVKVLTFGNISKMYQCVTQDLQVKVSKNYVSVNEKELIQYLKVLTKFRNVCAHGDRLFTFTTKDDIPDTLIHTKLGITKRGMQYVYGKRDLFSVVIAFRYLLSKDDFSIFKRDISKIIDKFLRQTNHISHVELLHDMGFPINWKKVSSFKI